MIGETSGDISFPPGTFSGYFVPGNNGSLCVDDLLQRYIRSEYGQHQAGQPFRFTQFGLDNEVLLTDIGPDAHPIAHQYETAVMVTKILETERASGNLAITPTESGMVVFASGVHDTGECTHPSLGRTVGDIPFGQKTPQNRRDEARVLQKVLEEVYPDVHAGVLLRMRLIIGHHDTSVLHDLYEAGHCLRTLEAGRRSGAGVSIKRDQAILDALAAMATGNPGSVAATWLEQFSQTVDPEVRARGPADVLGDMHKLHAIDKAIRSSMVTRAQGFAERFVYVREYVDEYLLAYPWLR
jgi:hypothetical protein